MAKRTTRQRIIIAGLAGKLNGGNGSPGSETETPGETVIFRVTTAGDVRITTNNSERVTTESIQ